MSNYNIRSVKSFLCRPDGREGNTQGKGCAIILSPCREEERHHFIARRSLRMKKQKKTPRGKAANPKSSTTSSSSSSIQDIARAAGVSTATVSRVFSRHPYVSEKTRENVLKTAREMNYAPHIYSSRSLFGIMTSIPGAFSFDPYWNQLLYYTTKRLFELGCNAQIFGPAFLPYLHENSFRGVILTDGTYAEQIRASGIPVLLVNSFADGIPSVVTDHREGLKLAVDHLCRAGHSRIAFLRCAWNNWGSNQREAGYREALQKHGIAADETIIGLYSRQEEIPEVLSLLLKQKPTALIVEGENNGTIVNYALYLLNRQIPADLSLITFEDDRNSCYMTPPQTTISQDFSALGTAAAEIILNLSSSSFSSSRHVGKNAVPMVTTLPCNRLIERRSVLRIGPPVPEISTSFPAIPDSSGRREGGEESTAAAPEENTTAASSPQKRRK